MKARDVGVEVVSVETREWGSLFQRWGGAGVGVCVGRRATRRVGHPDDRVLAGAEPFEARGQRLRYSKLEAVRVGTSSTWAIVHR